MAFLRSGDTIAGNKGIAYSTINGQIQEMFYVQNFDATVTKNKTAIRTLGASSEQHKANGWSGSGTMSIYYVSSIFRDMMLTYIKTGVDTYFDVQIVNDDPSSTAGVQTTSIKRMNIDSVSWGKLDVDSDTLTEDVPFTFEDVDLLDQFATPVLG